MGLAARAWLGLAVGRCCLALRDPACAPLLGPPAPGATLPLGARVPGTSLELEPSSAAFMLGAMIRVERACAADHLAPLLAAADFAARHAHYDGVAPPTVATVLVALAQADAFEHALASDSSHAGDPWLCRRAADAYAAAALLGGDVAQQIAAARRAGRDGSSTRSDEGDQGAQRRYRRAAGENAARAVRHALAAVREDSVDAGAGGIAVPGQAIERAAAAATTPAGPLAAPSSRDACDGAAFDAAVVALYPRAQAAAIIALFEPGSGLEALAVDAFVARLVRN